MFGIKGIIIALAVAAAIGALVTFAVKVMNHMEDDATTRAELAASQALAATLGATIENMNAQLDASKAELAAFEETDRASNIRAQERDHEINQLRLTITQQAYDAPYRNSIDMHNQLSRIMRGVEDATNSDRGAPAVHTTGEASPDPVPATAD